jgi:hypothetical protein
VPGPLAGREAHRSDRDVGITYLRAAVEEGGYELTTADRQSPPHGPQAAR